MHFDVGVDIGTTNTKIYFKEDEKCFTMPSVVAIKKNSKKLIGVGKKAYKMLGKAPANIIVKKTMQKGVVSDFELNRLMMRKVLMQKIRNRFLLKPKICVCFHSFMTNLEKLVLKNSIFSSDSQKLYFIDESLASGIGAGADFSSESAFMIVNIGGGTTDILAISISGVLFNRSIQIGSEILDEMIYKNLETDHDFLIGARTAEELKKNTINVINPSSNLKFKLKGKDKITGLPKTLELTQKELSKNLSIPIKKIADNIIYGIRELAPESLVDINKNGILLTGGGSLTVGLKEFLENELQIKITLVKNNLVCAASGALKSAETLKDNLLQYILPA